MRHQSDDLTRSLAHVLWIGGPPDCGKTSITDILAQKHGLSVYHFDRHEMAHFARCTPEQYPALYAARPEVLTTEQRWLGSPPDVMAAETIACWTERFWMAVDDLLAMPTLSRIIAEGPGFFPECIAPIVSDRHKAIWLVPTETFKRASAARRIKPGNRHETSDPERATRNLIDRDLLMTQHVREQATARDLPLFEVDGSRNLEQMAARVEAHFAPWLP
jgi:hypothetical protein